MPRQYTATLFPQAVTASQDLFEVVSGSAKITRIIGIHLSQSTELGDTAEEQLTIMVRKQVDSSGSGGTTVIPGRMDQGDPNFSGTVEVGNTSKAGGSPDVSTRIGIHNWNIRAPLDIIYLPDMRPVLSPGERLVVELYQNPSDSITIGGYIEFEEIG